MKWRWIEKYNMTMTPLPHREGVFRAWEQTHKGKGDDESKDQMCWKKKAQSLVFPILHTIFTDVKWLLISLPYTALALVCSENQLEEITFCLLSFTDLELPLRFGNYLFLILYQAFFLWEDFYLLTPLML